MSSRTEARPGSQTASDSGPVARQRAQPPVGLYLHVPFCVSICPYCDFVVVAGSAASGPHNRIAAVTDAIASELDLRAAALDRRWGPPPSRPPLRSLYLGGGTPTLLPAATIARVVGIVRERYGLAPDAEVTIEANPGPDERGDLPALHEGGVTRLSIGAQSLDAAELRALGRRHRPEDVADTVSAARAAGIASVSLDLLYDIPGGSLDRWAATLDGALAMAPDHLSLYALTLDDPDAEGLTGPLGDHLPLRSGARRWREHARDGQDDDRAAAMYELADDRLAAAGYEWYEISNWARPGHESRHNLGYWQGRPWEAVGPGAHAFDGLRRRWNAANLGGYVAALTPRDGDSPALPPGGFDAVRPASGEAAMLALRTRIGIAAAALEQPAIGGALAWALDADLLRSRSDRLVLTRRGRLLSNEIFGRLLAPGDGLAS